MGLELSESGRHDRHYDAIVIGSGAGGSSIAHRLAQTGARILVVERGDFLKVPRRARDDEIGVYLGRFIAPSDPLYCVGGLTKFYGAALYRMRESAFGEVEHECGVSPAWPISYADLEPYYEQAEILYRVHGSDEGDPSAPGRRIPYPFPALPHHPIVSEMKERLAQAGTPSSAIPRGVDYAPGGRCVLCATCDAYYCRLDAKMDAEIAALRPALATGRVELMTRTKCVKVLTDAPGRQVTGVVLDEEGREFQVHSDVVAVCAGLPETALLLRRSRTDRHPHGLGNAGGALGKFLAGHPTAHIFPFVSARPLPPIHTKTLAINAFHDGAAGWPHPLGIVQIAGQMPFWNHARRIIRPAARAVGVRSLACFYSVEAIPSRNSGLVFKGDEIVGRVLPENNLKSLDKLRTVAASAFRAAGYKVLARARPPLLWHETGTARMGDDPSSSVTDSNCQVHGIKGLYVADQSVLPSAGAVNTTLTTIALALRAGDHIATQLLAVSDSGAKERRTRSTVS